MMGIYAITHRESGKRYIGQAKDIAKRWYSHRTMLEQQVHHCTHLQNAWTKYGAAAFDWDILLPVDAQEDLTAWEQAYLDLGTPVGLYNVARVAQSCRGVKRDPMGWFKRLKTVGYHEQRLPSLSRDVDAYEAVQVLNGALRNYTEESLASNIAGLARRDSEDYWVATRLPRRGSLKRVEFGDLTDFVSRGIVR